MNDEYISVTEAEKLTGIPTVTIRRYLTKHGHHLRLSKRHKSYLIANDSVPILIEIRDRYAAGLDTDQVEDKLVKSGKPTIIDVEAVSDEKDRIIASQAEQLERMSEFMNVVAHEIRELKRENTQLRDDVDHIVERRVNEAIGELMTSQQAIAAADESRQEEREKERDKNLTQVLRDIAEIKASANKSLWKRLFNG